MSQGSRGAGDDSRLSAIITVHVVPRASRTEVVGRHGDAIRIRLAAPPVDGAANDELVRFFVERLGVGRAAVTLKTGERGRRKTVAIDGVSRQQVERALFGG